MGCGAKHIFIGVFFKNSGCSTVIAVTDVTASTFIYAGKTVVKTIDKLTPNIVNHD
jgi:uncharacterized protein YceK